MNFKNTMVLLISIIGGCLAAMYIVKIFYVYFKSQKKVLGINVVRLNKDNYIFANDLPLKHYYEPKPNTRDVFSLPQLSARTHIATINVDGLNSEKNYTVSKPPRTFRIVALGDSFTYGVWVNTKDTWPSQLEELLNSSLVCQPYDQYEVLNLGVAGFDLLYEKTRFQKKGAKYSPDVVLWMVLSNDFDEVYELTADRFKEIAEKEFPQDIMDQPGGYGAVMRAVVEEFQKTHDASFWNLYYQSVFDDFFNLYQGKTVIIGLSGFAKYENTLREILGTRKNVLIDTELEEIYGDRSKRFVDEHPNEEGYKDFAQSILQYLIKHNIIPCQK